MMTAVSPDDHVSFERNGFIVLPKMLSQDSTADVIDDLHKTGVDSDRSNYGIRDIAGRAPTVRAIANGSSVRGLACSIIGENAFLVQSILFDKSREANWKVPWHQDLTIPVKSRIPAPGFCPWSEKSGIPHVQAPPFVLERMVILRLHLDDCFEDSGPLQVLPGSHRHGKLSFEQIQDHLSRTDPILCRVPAGGVLMMRPLLLHASSVAKVPSHRRVIHLEYAAAPLPGGLEWAG